MRRIDLLSKLCAPVRLSNVLRAPLTPQLFVSLFTTAAGYRGAIAILLGISLATAASELIWIGVVYRHFPVLSDNDKSEVIEPLQQEQQQERETWSAWLKREGMDWAEFVRMPVFGSR
jgi:hypothetical protein